MNIPEIPPVLQLTCRACGALDTPHVTVGRGPHALRANCRHCGEFVQWLSARSPAGREATRQAGQQAVMARLAPSPRQLAYLHALGDTGSPPATMAEASTRIDALRQRKEG
jgi:hypothetical protein